MTYPLEGFACVRDEWLSRVMGRPAGRWLSSSEDFDDVLKLQDFALVTARVDVYSTGTIEKLLNMNFRVVERSLMLELDRTIGFQEAMSVVNVRKARRQDLSMVARIAESSFSHDRFHQDKQISTGIADRIKAEWAKSFFAGARGREMLVAVDSESSDKPVGFLLVADGPAGELVIDLIGVDRNHHRQGHATRLVRAFLNLSTTTSIYRVGTQSTNVESLRLYKKLGFKVVGESVSLHFHNPSFKVTRP